MRLVHPDRPCSGGWPTSLGREREPGRQPYCTRPMHARNIPTRHSDAGRSATHAGLGGLIRPAKKTETGTTDCRCIVVVAAHTTTTTTTTTQYVLLSTISPPREWLQATKDFCSGGCTAVHNG